MDHSVSPAGRNGSVKREEQAMHELAEWQSFYVVIGGAAGALIGLQFVVMTLLANKPTTVEAAEAFATPTVVHFATSLLLAALASMPWHSAGVLAACWGAVGIAGLAYVLIVARHMRRQDDYKPILSDWVFNILMPMLGYALLAVAAAMGLSQAVLTNWLAASASLLLLLLGVRNSWEVVSYHVTVRMGERT
jgi:hypothetical protein